MNAQLTHAPVTVTDSSTVDFTLSGQDITATVLPAGVDHGGLAGLSDDDHTQYALLAGRSGGQTLIGGTASGNDLTLQSTSNATKGSILFGNSAYDEVNNRLGIGTASPQTALHVNGTIALERDTNNAIQWYATTNARNKIYSDTNNVMYFQSFGSWIWETNTPTQRMILTNAGVLGINNGGTALTGTLGAAQVQIDKTSNGTFLLHRESADTGGGTFEFLKRRSAWGIVTSGDRLGTIAFSAADSIDAANAAQIYAEVDGTPGSNDMPGRLIFATTADGANAVTERMRIDASGNIQVGGTTAYGRLVVTGTKALDGSQSYIQNIADNTAYNSSPIAGLRFMTKYTSGGTYAGMGGINVGKTNATDGNYSSYMAFSTRTSGSSIAERMRIDNAGNVGIGTSSMGYLLDVNGTFGATTSVTTPRVASTGTLNLVSSGAFSEIDFYNDATLIGGFGTTSATFNVLAQFFVTDAVTNAVSESMWLAHASSGTPAAGFGTSIGAYLESSTTPGRLAGHLQWKWDVATDASRASAGDLTAYYITTERTCFSWKANSTVPMIGFLGTAPVAKPAAYTQTYATADKTFAARTAAALTNNTGGTISTTLAAITAGAAYTQADMVAVKNALASLADQVNKQRTDDVDTASIVNSIIDDLQAYGLAA